MNALMEAYKEWTQSCLTPGEVNQVMGIAPVDAQFVESYSGSLGKGFTTDDKQSGGKTKAPSRFAVRTEVARADGDTIPDANILPEQSTRGKGKAKEKPAPRKAARKNSGQESEADDSSSSDNDGGHAHWSAESSSEDSAMDSTTSNNNTDDDNPDEMAVVKQIKRKRRERKEQRRRKRATREEEPSRKSSRKTKATSQMTQQQMNVESDDLVPPETPMDIDGDCVGVSLAAGADSLAAGADSLAAGVESHARDDVSTTADPQSGDKYIREPPAATATLTPMSAQRTMDAPPTTVKALPSSAMRRADPDDSAIWDIIMQLSPDVRLGVEKGFLKVASGLGDLHRMLDCGKAGLEFLVLPFNEFWQAEGSEQLRSAMEALSGIETILLDGFVSDTKGRKKAVIPVAKRPQIVSGWIGIGRCRVGSSGCPKPHMVIKREGLETFVKAWNVWWRALQPDWHVSVDGEGRWDWELYGDDWHTLTIPGQNGLLSMVATLSWWGSAVKLAEEGKAEWLEAVTDVEWMMTGLLGALEGRNT